MVILKTPVGHLPYDNKEVTGERQKTAKLESTSAVANMIRRGEIHAIRNLIRQGAKDGMQDLNAELMKMVKRGYIHYSDARRASNEPDFLY